VSSIGIAHSFFYKYYDDGDRRDMRRRYQMDDLTLEIPKWKHRSLMATLIKMTLIRFNPGKVYLSAKDTIMRNHSNWLFSSWKGVHSYGMRT